MGNVGLEMYQKYSILCNDEESFHGGHAILLGWQGGWGASPSPLMIRPRRLGIVLTSPHIFGLIAHQLIADMSVESSEHTYRVGVVLLEEE